MDGMKRTLRLRAESVEDVERAARLLAGGGTVAFPTETVYGLGANALDATAVQRIFAAKERPGWDPLIVHVSSRAMLGRVVEVTDEQLRARAERLMEAFWPGPLTMLLPRSMGISDAVTAGRARVGVRMPAHAVARELIARAGVPVAAPSANRFGRTSPTTAAHVLEDLDERIDAVLDGGPTSVGVESTVLDVCEWPMVIYRPGAVTAAQIEAVAGAVEVYRGGKGVDAVEPESLPSPGVGLRHYAPRARLVLVDDAEEMRRVVDAEGGRVGLMLPEGWEASKQAEVFAWGAWGDAVTLARRVFAGLRDLDRRGVDVIVCPRPAEGDGLTAALRDRLEKAARRH